MTDSVPTAPSSVAVIGLGIMGGAIARNLVASGWTVHGYDPSPEAAQLARQVGVATAESVAAAAAGAGAVLTSLPNDRALEATVEALASAHWPGATKPDVIELSTLTPAFKARMRERLEAAGIVMLDCPLSGTGAQARTRDLVLYGSGERTVFDRHARLFAGFTRAAFHVGEFGNGMRLKLVANLLVAIHNVATAEALALAERVGLDPAQACELLGAGSAASRILQLRGPLMVSDRYEPPTMKLDLWQKDLALIADFVRDAGAQAPLFLATLPLYEAAMRAGWGALDTAAVRRVFGPPQGP